MLKLLKKKTLWQAWEHFIIEPVFLSFSPSLPASPSLSVAADCLQPQSFESPLHLWPLLQFNYQQALSEEPEHESVIISFQGV